MTRLTPVYGLMLLALSSSTQAAHPFDLMIEGGALWQNRNDVQIRPDTGTRFELDKIDNGPFFHYRLEGYYRFNEKHALRAVYAPSTLKVTGRFKNTILFNGKTFPNTADLTTKYQFNSYRLSYLYGFWGFGREQLNLGLTAKIRDAKVSLKQPGVSSHYDNVGFVPLVYFEYQRPVTKNWRVNLTIDAAAASQGRAIDAALKARCQLNENTSLGLGVRTLEGGADNSKVYTFSWFNYLLAELSVSF